jgi:hypothetical protein
MDAVIKAALDVCVKELQAWHWISQGSGATETSEKRP